MSGDTLAAIVGSLAALLSSVGPLLIQDRRPLRSDQPRAYRALEAASRRAAKRRAQYDAAVADQDRALAVARAADTPQTDDDVDAHADPAATRDERVLLQMAGYAARMEAAVDDFDELIARSGARVARAVAAATGPQPVVPPPTATAAPAPARWHEHADPDNDDGFDEADVEGEDPGDRYSPQQAAPLPTMPVLPPMPPPARVKTYRRSDPTHQDPFNEAQPWHGGDTGQLPASEQDALAARREAYLRRHRQQD